MSHTQEYTFDRHIHNNILHREKYSNGDKLREIIERQCKYYSETKNPKLLEKHFNELRDEIEHFIDFGNYIPDMLSYKDKVTELKDYVYNLTGGLQGTYYESPFGFDTDILFRVVGCYDAYYCIFVYAEKLAKLIKKVSQVTYNYNYLKLIQDFKKSVDKETFIIEQYISNGTVYNQFELSEIERETNIKAQPGGFLYNESYLLNTFLTEIRELNIWLSMFSFRFQEILISRFDEGCEYQEQILDQLESLIDIKYLTEFVLTLGRVLTNLLNTENLTVEGKLEIANLNTNSYTIGYVKDLDLIDRNTDYLNKSLEKSVSSFENQILIADEFIKQKSQLTSVSNNLYNKYFIKPGSSIDNELKDTYIPLTTNQELAVAREQVKELNAAIDNSIKDWLNSNNRQHIKGLNISTGNSIKDIVKSNNRDKINSNRNTNRPNTAIDIDQVLKLKGQYGNIVLPDMSILTAMPGSYKYLNDSWSNIGELNVNTRSRVENLSDKMNKTNILVSALSGAVGAYLSKLINLQGLMRGNSLGFGNSFDLDGNLLDNDIALLNALFCILDKVSCALKSLQSTLKDLLSRGSEVVQSIEQLINDLGAIRFLPGDIVKEAAEKVNKIKDEMKKEFKSKIDEVKSKIDAIQGLPEKASQTFKDACDKALNMCEKDNISDLMDELLNAVSSALDFLGFDSSNSKPCKSLLGNKLGSLSGIPDFNLGGLLDKLSSFDIPRFNFSLPKIGAC